ncbi:hypothetical protein IEE94_09555 [Yimella sp. cx-573]|nr:hypothetical protein [Yimella sp. cx-573]
MSMYPGEPKRRGLAFTIIGAVMMLLLAPAAFVIGTVIGVKAAVDLVQDVPMVQSGNTVPAQAGQVLDLYAYIGADSSGDGVDSSADPSFGDVPACTVTGPSGQDVEVRPATGTAVWTRDGMAFGSAGSFTAESAGDYRIACGDKAALVPDGDQAKKAGEQAGWGIGLGLAIATVLGILGLIMLIVGIVKLVNSGKERTQFRLQQQMGQWQQPYYR